MNRTKRTTTLAAAAALTCVAGAQATFTPLGLLPGGAVPVSRAYGVSNNGAVVVGYSSSTIGNQAFRWTQATGLQGLGILSGGTTSQARKVSGDGSVIVGESGSTSGPQAFRWTASGGMAGLGDLVGGLFNSSSVAVSENGSIIVGKGTNASNFSEAARWTQATGWVGLGFLPQAQGESHTFDITGDGTKIVGYSSTTKGLFEAFIWTSAGMVGIGDLAGGVFDSRAYGVSDNGLFVVGRGDSGTRQAFRYSVALKRFTGLGWLSGYGAESRARGVTEDGNVVVGRSENASMLLRAFVWMPTQGILDFQTFLASHGAAGLAGWSLEEAYSMTPDGKFVVGYGIDPQGVEKGWIAKMPPRLSTLSFPARSVFGGRSLMGTVSLGFVHTANLTVTLTSNSNVAKVPANIQIAASQPSAQFTMTTVPVTAITPVTVRASFDGEVRSFVVNVKPAALSRISLSAISVKGGGIVTSTVYLTSAAAAPAVVALASSMPAVASVPPSVTVATGAIRATSSVATSAVASQKIVTLSATYAGVTKTTTLTVNP